MTSKTINYLYNYLGERGVYSCDPETLSNCFDVFRYEDNIFCYRLKSTKDIKKIKPKNKIDGLFKDIVFHDSMQNLIMREEDHKVNFIKIDDENDVLENEFGIKYNEYKEIQKKSLTDIYEKYR